MKTALAKLPLAEDQIGLSSAWRHVRPSTLKALRDQCDITEADLATSYCLFGWECELEQKIKRIWNEHVSQH